ncbi:MAG: endonuclease MutS2, partial [Thermodesulfovibrionales bacterium]
MMEREALKSLEFYRIIDDLAGHCHSEATVDLIRNISPFNDINSIHERFGQIKEIMRLREEGNPLGLYDFHDISGLIEKVRPEGIALETKDLLLLLPILRLVEDISGFLRGRNLIYLKPLSEGLSGFPFIRSRIERTIDNDGNILDSASPTLSDLRNKKRSLEKRIRRRLEEIIADKRIAPFLQDNFISMRSGRWVIPVRMDSKGEVKGVVHDVSRSGDTAFIEPVEIIGLSNELENIIAEEKVEELRILRGISDMIRAEAGEIERQFRILVTIDLINSIALFSERIKAQIPDINESGFLRLHDARHPVLLISRRYEEIVPLNIEVKSERVVVITGPNAGGKTVAVKTVGLLTAMALSGIPIPADSSS